MASILKCLPDHSRPDIRPVHPYLFEYHNDSTTHMNYSMNCVFIYSGPCSKTLLPPLYKFFIKLNNLIEFGLAKTLWHLSTRSQGLKCLGDTWVLGQQYLSIEKFDAKPPIPVNNKVITLTMPCVTSAMTCLTHNHQIS